MKPIKTDSNPLSLIFIGGSPGSGKTTVSELLHEKFQSVLIDFGCLRIFHLDPLWEKASKKEEQMAFEHPVYILKNYIRNGYQNVMVNDLKDFRIRQIPEIFAGENYIIITFVLSDDEELRTRILDPNRDSGFRNVEKTLAWNRAIIERETVLNEYNTKTNIVG